MALDSYYARVSKKGDIDSRCVTDFGNGHIIDRGRRGTRRWRGEVMAGGQVCLETGGRKPMAAPGKRSKETHVPGLSAREEQDLILKAQNGAWEARDRLMAEMEPRIRAWSGKAYAKLNSQKHIFDLDDIRQHVSIAFDTAIGKYDAAKTAGARFTTYAWYWVKQELALMVCSESGLGRREWERMRRVREAVEELLKNNLRARESDIARVSKLTRAEVERILEKMSIMPLGFPENGVENDADSLADHRANDPLFISEAETRMIRRKIDEAIRRQNDPWLRDFVDCRFDRGMKYKDISLKMNMRVDLLKQKWHRAKVKLQQDGEIKLLFERLRG
jgi:RNA polymerase sigma factor (sigma-70 family)